MIFERFDRSAAVLYHDFASKKTTEVFRLPGRNFGFTPGVFHLARR